MGAVHGRGILIARRDLTEDLIALQNPIERVELPQGAGPQSLALVFLNKAEEPLTQ